MRFLFFSSVIYLLSFAIHVDAYSQWFETTGQAYINNNETKTARNRAIESALKKTLLIAGASVSSVQQVVNGLLTKDEVNIRATGILNSFEVISENYTDKLAEVTIRADIIPQDKQCYSADYRKSLLLTRSYIINREQANIGNIYQLDKQVIAKLANNLKKDSRYLHTKVNLKNKTQFSRLNNSQQAEQIKSLTMSLADISDSQFVMYSEITDISFANSTEKTWEFWQDDIKNRHFNMTVYLFDGLNGELTFEKSYSSTTPWLYNVRENIDLHSDKFWHEQYGAKITRILKDVSLDIEEALMCQPTQGKIISTNGQQLVINLGKRHGVKVGDEFSLLANANMYLDNGKTYSGYNVSPYKVKVTQTNRDNATLVTVNNEQLGNIQINDLAVRY